MKVTVNAKLNLDLSVLGANNGYHQLRSHVVSVDISDTVTVVPRSDNNVTINQLDGIAPHDNIAYNTARMFVDEFGCAGCDIIIDKDIPLMSGMGGSSADSAGVLVALCALNDIDISDYKVIKIASIVGSDVMYMMTGGDAIISGKGDNVEPLTFVERYFVLTTFDQGVSTKDVFDRYDRLDPQQLACASAYLNHLQYVVEGSYDYMQGYMSTCQRLGYQPILTGSGSAYFVQVSEREATVLAQQLCNVGYKSRVCRSTKCGICIER